MRMDDESHQQTISLGSEERRCPDIFGLKFIRERQRERERDRIEGGGV
jgi:hypothetical protein